MRNPEGSSTLSAGQAEKFDGFYAAPLGYFRRSKLAYFAVFTDETFRLLRQLKEMVDPISAVKAWHRSPQVFTEIVKDAMTSEELNISESVADFIQGITPKSIGAQTLHEA